MFEMKSPNLVDVYIPPKLSKSTVIKCPYNKIVHFEITKLDEVFRNTGYKAKHIYITAKAGVGKSTFCKFIVRLWCAFQRNDKDAIKSLKSRGAGAYLNNCDELKNVQYVFYARLSQSRSILCEMDEIVFEQVIRRLSMSENYDKKFLQAVLGKERCLVIFDSLDEWCHPDVMNTRCFAEDKESPHERNREKCTVMIASRHWKLGLPKMHSKKSNLCVEIEELDGTNIQSLVKQAFTLIVGDSEQTKPIEELFRWIDQKGLDHLLGSTLVVWQLLFLWHEGHLLGESKCQVYCNVLEMMFTKVLKKYSRVQHFAAVDHPQPDTIKCLQTRTHCMMFQEYIRNLGKMAFYSLFDVETLDDQMESNLPKSLGTSHKEELGLLAGLLSKTQVHASSVNPRYEYSFLHKTYHEMLACVYIASVSYNSEEHERIVETIKNSGQTFSLDMMQFICGMHETWSKEMFEIYCDMQTTMLCRGSYIELPAVKVFHKNCLNIIKEFGANKTATMKMRSLLLDSTYNYGSKISTKEFGEISFMALKVKKHKQRDMFDGVQDIVGHCKMKLNYLSIKNYDVDNAIPCPIASKTMQSCINLHTLILRNLTIVGELDLTGCSLLSILDLSLPKEGEHVRLIISPKRLRQCSISIDDFVVSYTINIKCTCPFNSELLEGLFLWNVKLEDNLRLLDCEQLQVLALINVNTRNITTCFEYGKLIFCCLGGFTYPAAMKGALQSLQYSQNLNFLSIWYLNDSITTSLNKTLLSLENIEEIQLFFSESIIRDLQIPVSVKTLSASAIFISADCLIKLINTFKASHAEVDFDLSECFVSPCDEVTIENIVREIKQCNQCVLNEASFPCEDEMEEESVFGFKMNVRKLDFKITRGRQDE
ncbi:uncharacterized protein LOC128245458 isoform X2 [Mya arenaria]|nr:uncharacterized protein LOC128245458 isoform X2 [Mya arenaria]